MPDGEVHNQLDKNQLAALDPDPLYELQTQSHLLNSLSVK